MVKHKEIKMPVELDVRREVFGYRNLYVTPGSKLDTYLEVNFGTDILNTFKLAVTHKWIDKDNLVALLDIVDVLGEVDYSPYPNVNDVYLNQLVNLTFKNSSVTVDDALIADPTLAKYYHRAMYEQGNMIPNDLGKALYIMGENMMLLDSGEDDDKKTFLFAMETLPINILIFLKRLEKHTTTGESLRNIIDEIKEIDVRKLSSLPPC